MPPAEGGGMEISMADFDKSTFDPKAAAEARKKEMDQMAEKLEAGVRYASIRFTNWTVKYYL